MSGNEQGHIPCYRCGSEARLIEQLLRLGKEPGARVFRYVACDELTWTPVTPMPPSEPEKR